jgi:hypothetical protein
MAHFINDVELFMRIYIAELETVFVEPIKTMRSGRPATDAIGNSLLIL